jgi:uncharacterized protein
MNPHALSDCAAQAAPIDAAVRAAMQASVLCWLATADADGQPNVSPKEVFCAEDDGQHVLVAHIASPHSLRNLQVNPRVCLSFVDVFVQKGYKLSGSAQVLQAGDALWPAAQARLATLAGPRFVVRAAIRIRVQAVQPIIAPSYRFYPGTTEATQVASAMQRYGVRPLPADGEGEGADEDAAKPNNSPTP